MEGRKKLQMVAKKIRTRKIEPTEEKNQRERSRWEAMGVRLFVNCYWKCSEFSRRLDSSALVTGAHPAWTEDLSNLVFPGCLAAPLILTSRRSLHRITIEFGTPGAFSCALKRWIAGKISDEQYESG